MKKFNDFDSAFEWGKKIVEKGAQKGVEAVAEQLYKDSNEFTYRETGTMYQSGEIHSQFDKGLIIERSPYVRRRYYEGGTPGAGNRQAQARWFDKTWNKHKNDYKKIMSNALDEAKKENL